MRIDLDLGSRAKIRAPQPGRPVLAVLQHGDALWVIEGSRDRALLLQLELLL